MPAERQETSAKGTLMRSFVTVTLGLLLFASGFARAQELVLPLPPQDQQNITAQLGPNVVGAALPSRPIADPSIYFPLQAKVQNYQVVAGPNAGNVQALGVTKTRRPGGRSAWRFAMSPTLAGFIRENTEGDIIMAALTDSGEGVVVVTTPANPFVPKGIQPGETRNYTQHVSVNYLDDPSDQRYSGTLTGTYTYVGTYQVTVPAGTFPAILFRVKCEGKVGPAHTQNIGYNFFAPGVGMVAMILQEDVTAFWLFNIDTTTGKVLMAN
ncbi:MAG: hypothetical protein WBE78_09245 [Candidatus Binataceae bacterium]